MTNGDSKTSQNLWVGIIVVALIILLIYLFAQSSKKECSSNKEDKQNTQTDQQVTKSIVASPKNNIISLNQNPQKNTDQGFYKTLENGTFIGVQPNTSAKPNISPNEEMLEKIRREKYHYREKISDRNAGQYIYPNKLGWWPRASYGAGVRLEPGQWPKYDNPPFSIGWRSDVQPCGPDNPSTYGGPNNEGIPVNAWGRIVRRGMCVNGVADCPLGQTAIGGTCVGEAQRDAFGDLIWSRTEWASPLTDISDINFPEKLEGQEIGLNYH